MCGSLVSHSLSQSTLRPLNLSDWFAWRRWCGGGGGAPNGRAALVEAAKGARPERRNEGGDGGRCMQSTAIPPRTATAARAAARMQLL